MREYIHLLILFLIRNAVVYFLSQWLPLRDGELRGQKRVLNIWMDIRKQKTKVYFMWPSSKYYYYLKKFIQKTFLCVLKINWPMFLKLCQLHLRCKQNTSSPLPPGIQFLSFSLLKEKERKRENMNWKEIRTPIWLHGNL